MKQAACFATAILATTALGLAPAGAAAFFFSTGTADGRMATASRPDVPPGTEIESADDFVLTDSTRITGATFTGLLPTGAPLSSVAGVVVEIYRVFPKDSVNPPSGQVPSRVNSPSDIAFDSRNSVASTLSFTAAILSTSFTAGNSVLNGIHPKPSQTTGGEGPVIGEEVEFTVNFTSPLDLPPDHYFFIPQVQLSSGDFYWLSAAKPIVPPGTPFAPDLQEWIRNSALDPDWLRVGTDIVGTGAFNATFSLTGVTVAEPAPMALLSVGLLGLWMLRRRGRA